MSDLRIERDERQQVISDAIWEHAIESITANLPTAAKALMAEEDLRAAVHSLIERLDEAGLTVVPSGTHRATTYTVYPTGYDEMTFSDKYTWTLKVEERGDSAWAVIKMGSVLNADGEWEYEPSPSSRGDDFLARTRFPLEEALRRADAVVDSVVWNGHTAAQADIWMKQQVQANG